MYVVGLLVCLVTFAPEQGAWGRVPANRLDREIAAQEQARLNLERRIQLHNEAVSGRSQQERMLREHLSVLQQNSEITQQQIELLEEQMDRLQNAINALDAEIAETSYQKEFMVSELGARLVNIFKYGSREELNLLLSSESLNEAMASAYLLRRLAHHERLVIEDLLAKASALEQGRRNIESSRTLLAARARELDSLREEYFAAISHTSEQIAGIQMERRRVESAIWEMGQAQRDLERSLGNLTRQRRDSILAEMPVARDVQPIPALGGNVTLNWPLRGAVASRFGPNSDTGAFNSGIAISAPSGSPVRAAASGIVLFGGWLQGFGQVVIIDHGRNMSTVYAHLATSLVSERDTVAAGAVIGTVGNTGTAEGYSLHFEVRVGDSARNPMDYLRGI